MAAGGGFGLALAFCPPFCWPFDFLLGWGVWGASASGFLLEVVSTDLEATTTETEGELGRGRQSDSMAKVGPALCSRLQQQRLDAPLENGTTMHVFVGSFNRR